MGMYYAMTFALWLPFWHGGGFTDHWCMMFKKCENLNITDTAFLKILC